LLEKRSGSRDDVAQAMKICIFLMLMAVFIGTCYSAAGRREAKARLGSGRSGGSLMPRG